MSEILRRLRMLLIAAPAILILVSGLPSASAAQTCYPLGGSFALCGHATIWADATKVDIDDDDDVFAYEIAPLYLEASLEWLAPSTAQTATEAIATLAPILAEEATADGDPPPIEVSQDLIATELGDIALTMYVETFATDTVPLAVLVAPDDRGWMTLFLSSDDDITVSALETQARLLASLLRPEAGRD